MTPAEHYAAGESLLAAASSLDQVDMGAPQSVLVRMAEVHFLAAIAGELGVPTGILHIGVADQSPPPSPASPPPG